MYSVIFTISSIFLCLIIIHLILKKFNILQKNKDSQSLSTFMNTEHLVELIGAKASLTEEEQRKLTTLLTLVSGNNLRFAFDEKSIGTKWLVNTRRAIFHSNQFDEETKEDLEYTLYEIHRKIDNVRMLTHPYVKSISDLSIGQILEIKINSDNIIKAEVIDTGFSSFYLSVLSDYITTAKINKLKNKTVQITFWKKLDAYYGFQSTIQSITNNKDTYLLNLSTPKKIECIKIRTYPRQDTEIPVKFKLVSFSSDEDSGALKETYGATMLGIINNIGPNGCSIIYHYPIVSDTITIIEFPLFDKIIYTKGRVRNIKRYRKFFIIHIEFTEEMARSNILHIYHYIFAHQNLLDEQIKNIEI